MTAPRLTPVIDAVGVLGALGELYPETPAEAWEPYREAYPELFADGAWRIPCTSYLIHSEGTAILVDTGVGPSGLWDWDPEWEGGLPEALDPAAVDIVFFTHLHIDHVGWNTDADGKPLFPRARYVVHEDGLAAAHRREHPHIRRCILPIEFDTVSGETELAPGVIAFPLPGHYPGHMGVRVGDETVLIGDAAVHPALLEHPDWLYIADGDRVLCAQTRRDLLPELEGKLVVCGHYPADGLGRLEGDGRWRPL